MYTIPSMGGALAGPILRQAASELPGECDIVEVGAWLGAGTFHLCEGAALNPNRPRITCFDRWCAATSEVIKAAAVGVHITAGQDLLPIIKRNLRGFEAKVQVDFRKCNINTIAPYSRKIGLYVDDASKTKSLFDHAMAVFKPQFIEGATVVLMDFYYYRKKPEQPELLYQHSYLEQSGQFMHLCDLPGTSAAVFRYLGTTN